MKLTQLLENIKSTEIVGSSDRPVAFLSQNTREDFPENTLYFAVVGTIVDGHDFIDQAIKKGAAIVVCEKKPEELLEEVTYIVVENAAKVISEIAGVFFGNPSKELKVIGVTGTNGKTTVATSIYESLRFLKKKAALLSTIHNVIEGDVFHSDLTTGGPIEVQSFMRQALDAGCEYLCMEVSSHSLDQYRVDAVDFNIGIFTNLSQDHLDYHKTMEHYASSKKKFFMLLNNESVAIYNNDDSYGEFMVSDTAAEKVSYGKEGDFAFTVQDFSSKGTNFILNEEAMTIQQIGEFSVYNSVATYISLLKLDFDTSKSKDAISHLQGVAGRLEIVTSDRGVTGIVDYAHTPDALKNVLETLQEIPHRKIITVFGCGGDRDRSKRAQMALIAETHSDIIIVTSDNPRTEDQQQIFADIESGFTKSFTGHALILDREDAIRRSVMIAQEGDILLLAGKGHEDYQIFGTEKQYFDDRKTLEKYLN